MKRRTPASRASRARLSSLGVDVSVSHGIKSPERIVREPGQVDDRVEAGEVGGPHIADVANAPDNPLGARAEVTATVEVGVEASDVVPAGGEERPEHRPDVAEMSGDEDSHGLRQTLVIRAVEANATIVRETAAMPIDWEQSRPPTPR